MTTSRTKNQLTVRDRGWNQILENVRDSNGARLTVGVQGSQGEEQHDGAAGLTVAEIAGIQEFGSRDGRIPERSFLRATLDAGQNVYLAMMRKIANGVMLGSFDVKTGLGLLGEQVVSDVQDRIEAGVLPENAPSTIRQKGSSKPLVNTSQMRKAISWLFTREFRDIFGRFASPSKQPRKNGRFVRRMK